LAHRRLRFVTVDVFAAAQFGGNPLAVVFDAQDLSTAQMQAIAAEFNLSETSFVHPPKEAAHTAQVRIFTPKAEMPFAGHPNIGAAFAVAQLDTLYGRHVGGDRFVFEEIAGLVELELMKERATIVGASLTAPQPLQIGDLVPVETVATACSLSSDDIETARHAPCVVSCGTLFVFAELKTVDALARALPRIEVFAKELPMSKATGIHLYAQSGEAGIDIKSRMFAPLYGIMEDPATGSANVALMALLAHLRPEPELVLSKTISQGVEMGRPSILQGTAIKKAGATPVARIGGACASVMRGVIELEV
jgi:trans-2,3-dihydro-3-hydroxyanthranilate isomerase